MRISKDERQLRESLAANVRRARDHLSLSQEEAAERAGVGVKHWQDIERARTGVTLEMIARLAKVLRVSAASLFV